MSDSSTNLNKGQETKETIIKIIQNLPDKKLDFYKGQITFIKNGRTILTKIEEYLEETKIPEVKN